MAYAGRTEGGDLKWTFNNPTDDSSSAIDVNLKNAIENYQSKVITGITNVPVTVPVTVNSAPVNLAGQPVSGGYRGIVIEGGKKVIR
jgi:hypothetical protein